MQRITLMAAIFCGLFLVSTSTASAHRARHHHHHVKHHAKHHKMYRVHGHASFHWSYRERATRMLGIVPRDTIMLAHPSGCPHRAFCGCGAMRYLGMNDRSLWLAAAWLRYPRTAPAPRMVAVRGRHHVVVLLHEVRGSVWRVYDANSGRHQTREHNIDISRFSVRDPTGRSALSSFSRSPRAHRWHRGRTPSREAARPYRAHVAAGAFQNL